MNSEERGTLILGLGNILMGDEGVGVTVAHRLAARPLPEGVSSMDGGTGGFTLLGTLEEAARIILVDAAADDHPVGTVTRLEPRFARDYPPTLTAHDIGVKDLLDIFYMRGGGAVTLYAITIDPHQPLEVGLSPVIEQAANEAVERIVQELAVGVATA
jgi:hydrogenase maturation protease